MFNFLLYNLTKSCVMVPSCNFSTWKLRQKGPEFKDRLGYLVGRKEEGKEVDRFNHTSIFIDIKT